MLDKNAVKEMLYAKLQQLLNSPDEDIAIKAAKELGTIAGIYADVSPRSITAQQTNTFVLDSDKMSEALAGLKKIAAPTQGDIRITGNDATPICGCDMEG